MAIYSFCAILAETVSGTAKTRPERPMTEIWHGDGSWDCRNRKSNLPCAQGKEQQERDEQIYTGKRKTGIHGGKAGKGDPGL
jgi:hypothetical protein